MRTADEKREFAERLRQAMGRSRKRVQTPTELANAFNLRYHGKSITIQAAYKWINGLAAPAPDKIAVLAEIFGVPVQWLRFGIADVPKATSRSVTTKEIGKPVVPTTEELQMLARLRAMPAHRRKLLADLVLDLSLEHEAWRE